MQTEEIRSWCDCSRGGEVDKAVLLCYGDPWVGKTFINQVTKTILRGRKSDSANCC